MSLPAIKPTGPRCQHIKFFIAFFFGCQVVLVIMVVMATRLSLVVL